MTIDEAIEKHKKLKIKAEITNDKRGAFYSGEEHEQIVEWLEELKALRNWVNIKCDNLNEALKKGKKIGYNNAIDDFVNASKRNSLYQVFGLRQCDIEEIAEQLKESE